MLDYQTNDPKGWCGDPSRGAALGRPEIRGEYTGQTLFITRKQLDGDYDENGTYFGQGEPLFWVHSEDGDFDFMLRALTLERARDKTRDLYPNAKLAGDIYNVSIDRELLVQLLQSEVESCDGGGDREAELNDEILEAAAQYEAAVLKVVAEWVSGNLSKIRIEENGIEPDADGLVTESIVRELSDLRGGAGYLYYMEADGAGVGTWDGGWDHMFVSEEAIRELSVVVKAATHAEYQKLNSALMNCASEGAQDDDNETSEHGMGGNHCNEREDFHSDG